jgi:hypothetical protein
LGYNLLNDYFVSITSSGEPLQWQWEIKRRPQPIGIKLYANGFKSEKAAKLAGEKALRELLDQLLHPRRGANDRWLDFGCGEIDRMFKPLDLRVEENERAA